MENNWLNQIKDMEKSRQKIYRALPFFSTQLPHNFPKKKLQTGTSESISGTCWRLTSTTTTFAYTSPFLLREAASISTVAISFDFALLQLISFLLDFARGAKDQFSFGRDLPFYTILHGYPCCCPHHCCTFSHDDRAHPQLLFKKEMRKITMENKWKNHTIKYNKIIFTCRFAWK